MNGTENEDVFHRGISRIALNHRGERIRLPRAISDTAHRDAYGSGDNGFGVAIPACNDTAFGVPVPDCHDPGIFAKPEPPPDLCPDADGDDGCDGNATGNEPVWHINGKAITHAEYARRYLGRNHCDRVDACPPDSDEDYS